MPYIKEVFQPTNLQHAKDICLSPDSNDPDKFQKETDFFVEWLIAQGFVSSDLKIADFGCGVGRISRELIIKTNCNFLYNKMISCVFYRKEIFFIRFCTCK